MKKLIALLLALVMVVGLVACGNKEEAAAPVETEAATEDTAPSAGEEGVLDGGAEVGVEAAPEVTVMSHEDYVAAELDAEVVIETYVQDHQSWWEDKITV